MSRCRCAGNQGSRVEAFPVGGWVVSSVLCGVGMEGGQTHWLCACGREMRRLLVSRLARLGRRAAPLG